MSDQGLNSETGAKSAIRRHGASLPADNPTFRNPAFESASLRILIVRLSSFKDVDRSTPHLLLAGEARDVLTDAFIDMAFFPSEQDRRTFAENKTDWIVGVQSLRSGRDFDVILISNSFVLELINLPTMLRKSSFPLWMSERENVRPIIILGGSNAMAAQSIIREDGDSMADAVFFGEGEGQVGRILKTITGNCRKERLESLKQADLSGLWVAGSFPDRPIKKAVLESPAGTDITTRYPVLNSPEASVGRIQISYGCPAFCSFCFEGYDRKPYREIKLGDIVETAEQLKKHLGCRDIDLYSFNFNTYSELLPLLTALHKLFVSVGFKSQRVDILSENRGLLPIEIAAGKSSFTLGIEGISGRCRALLHKSLASHAIDSLLAKMFREKIRELKLFYILTGHENADDVAEFAAFVSRCRGYADSLNRGIRVIFSFGMLVRMPGTPLQFDQLKMDSGAWRQLSGKIKSICDGAGFEYRLATTWQEYAVSQIMAIGGHWLWKPIVELAEKDHFYDGRLPGGYWDQFRGWMEQHGEWNDALLGEKDKDYPFAMSFIGSRIDKSFLYDQYLRTIDCKDDGYCLGRVSGNGVCLACGACIDNKARKQITAKREPINQNDGMLEKLAEIVKAKARMSVGLIIADIHSGFAGASGEWLNSEIMRQLLASFPDEIDNILSVQEMLFTKACSTDRSPVPFYGEAVFEVKAWDLERFMARLQSTGQMRQQNFRSAQMIIRADETVKLKSAELSFLCRQSSVAAPEKQFSEFMLSQHIPFTLRRMETGYNMVFTGKKRGRELISAGSYFSDENGCLFRLTIGHRFKLGMISQCFGDNTGPVKMSGLTL